MTSLEFLPHPEPAAMNASATAPFVARVTELFDAHFQRLYRVLHRMSGEPELAADLAQDAFVRLHRRGSLPDAPEAWLITVALNLYRNARSTDSRRRRLMTVSRAEEAHSDPSPAPDEGIEAEESHRRVRLAIEQLPERDQQLLLLRAEGYSYRDLAVALELNEASVGTLLARAKRTFRDAYGGA